MKTLIVVRHAKSSWAEPGLNDFDRPLNDRGKHDAPDMAIRLRKKEKEIDLFISSPAKRAHHTCRFFCKEYDVPEKKIKLVDELYNASAQTIYRVIASVKDSHKQVALFAHNPGITEFVNTLIDDVKIDNMPTCGIFGVKADIHDWADFFASPKKFLFFDYPKNL